MSGQKPAWTRALWPIVIVVALVVAAVLVIVLRD